MKSICVMAVLLVGALLGIARLDQWANASPKTIGEISHSLKSGTTAFHISLDDPHKIILFPESTKVKTSYSIVCISGRDFAFEARTFTTPYTRNLLYKIPPHQDRCDLVVAASTPTDKGQIVIDARIR